MSRNCCQSRGAVDARRLEHVLRDGGQRRVQDEERERQVVPHGDGPCEEQRRDRLRAPRKLRHPEAPHELRHHADVGLEHVAPHDDAAALGDRVGREDHGDDQRLAGQRSRQQHGKAEPERHFDVDDRVDEEEGVPERAPEDPVAEELRVVGQAHERRVASVRRRREAQPADVERRDDEEREQQHERRRHHRVVQRAHRAAVAYPPHCSCHACARPTSAAAA